MHPHRRHRPPAVAGVRQPAPANRSVKRGMSGQAGAAAASPPGRQPWPGKWVRCAAPTVASSRQGRAGAASPATSPVAFPVTSPGPQPSTSGPAPVTARPGPAGPASAPVTATRTCSARSGHAMAGPPGPCSATSSNRYSPYSGRPATVRDREAAGLRRGPHGTAPETPVLRCAGVRKTQVNPGTARTRRIRSLPERPPGACRRARPGNVRRGAAHGFSPAVRRCG